MTSRWAVDVVKPERDLNISWEPISLLYKNNPPEGSEYYGFSLFTHKLLRVMLAVKQAEGEEAARRFYWQCGAVLHHDRVAGAMDPAAVLGGDAAPFLAAAGLDASYNAAFEDEAWDAAIRSGMDAGLALVGNDVGTPILAFDTKHGRQGIFGPVISRMPEGEDSVALWDAMVTMSTMQGFWELKRTRTEDPNFPERPQ
ncbi:MAG: hypothetical protein AAF567_08810 [Actinomycetota bacterium]